MPGSIIKESAETLSSAKAPLSFENKEKIDKLLEDLEIKEADIINDLYTVHFKPVSYENRNS